MSSAVPIIGHPTWPGHPAGSGPASLGSSHYEPCPACVRQSLIRHHPSVLTGSVERRDPSRTRNLTAHKQLSRTQIPQPDSAVEAAGEDHGVAVQPGEGESPYAVHPAIQSGLQIAAPAEVPYAADPVTDGHSNGLARQPRPSS
jgi:hypothetical protein